MGYLFLCTALFSGAVKGFCGKKISTYTNDLASAMLANGIRMVFCTVIGLVIVFAGGHLSALIPSKEMLLICAISGICTAVFVVSWLITVRKSAYVMLEVFLMLGTLIPLIASSVLYQELIKPVQWLGIAVLLGAVMLMCSYHNSIKEKITLSSFLLLLVCGIANGVADLSQKVFVMQLPNGSVAAFNFYTYLFAALVLFAALPAAFKAGSTAQKTDPAKLIPLIAIMAACIFANSFYKTLAAEHLPAVLLYPLNQGAALIISSIMAVIFFKEKLTFKAVVGIIAAFCGLIIINTL